MFGTAKVAIIKLLLEECKYYEFAWAFYLPKAVVDNLDRDLDNSWYYA